MPHSLKAPSGWALEPCGFCEGNKRECQAYTSELPGLWFCTHSFAVLGAFTHPSAVLEVPTRQPPIATLDPCTISNTRTTATLDSESDAINQKFTKTFNEIATAYNNCAEDDHLELNQCIARTRALLRESRIPRYLRI